MSQSKIQPKIHPTADVEPGSYIGPSTVIWHYCHIRSGAVIGHNCSLGRNVYVDDGVSIGSGTRIQNNVSIYKGVKIESLCFIGPHVVFTNDKRPRVGQPWEITDTLIKTHASIGAGAVVVCGFTVGEYAMVGAGAVVCRDILPYEQVVGFSKHVGFVDKDGSLI